MNDNGKGTEELSPEALEQAAGGGGIYTTASDANSSKWCDRCKAYTTWIYLFGNYVCGSCSKPASNGSKTYSTRPM